NTQLNSGQPPFCGNIGTTNCVKVTINAAPPDEEDFVTICAPNCYLYHGQNFCATGTYVKNLTQNNCTFTATLHLTVISIPITNLNEIICQGECSQTPGFETACTQGIYTEHFDSYQDCDSTVRLNLTVINPIANIVPPGEIGCGQPSMPLQGIGSSTGGGITYTWTASNGGHFVGPTNGLNTSVSSAGDYQLKVCKFSGGQSCCDSTSVTVIQNLVPPNPPAGINGNNVACMGQTLNLSATPVGGAGTYTWTVPPGVVINSGQGSLIVSLTWNSPNGGDVCVSFTNSCGTSPETCLPITVTQPAVPVTPAGPAVVCAGSTETYTVPANPNATNYIWTVTAPATIASGQGTNSIIVNWGNVSAGSVCIKEASDCGTSQPFCLPVQISASPASPTVMGSNLGCTSGVANYSVTAVSGATSYSWQVTGGTITSGSGTTAIQVTWDAAAASGSVCASAINACGTSAANCLNVTLSPPPAQPVVTGNGAICAGTTGVYTILPINNVTGYTWTVPTGAGIVSGQNTTSITVMWTAAPGGNVCVSANSGCGSGPQGCFPVVVTPQPVANAGPSGVVCGNTFTLQAVPSLAGSTGQWSTVPGMGTATFANPNNAMTTVTVNPTGTYMFIWQEQLNTCTSDDSITVVFNANPTAGPISHQCDGTTQEYTVSFPISGGTSPYTVPGGTVTAGVFTSSPIASGTPFSFQVTDANGCKSNTLTGTFDCSCTTSAGTMSLQLISACADGSIAAQSMGDEVLDGNDVISYVLHTGSSAALGTVLSQNATGVFTFQNGMAYDTTYYVSVVAGNSLNGVPDPLDPCFSVATGQPVVWHPYPVANAGLDADTCGLTLPLKGNPGPGTWAVVSSPTGGTLQLSDAQSATATATASLYGAYQLSWTMDVLGCADADSVQLTFNSSPAAGLVTTDCDATNQSYTVTFPLSGGMPPYTVNNMPVVGTSYTSGPITSGANYDFTVNDANNCTTANVTGSYICNCTSQAGTMDTAALASCEGGTVTATHLGGQNLDGNDTTSYILHTGNGTTLGTVFDQNTTGTFSFQNGMAYGTTYYISFVVGDNLSGQPDPNDPCLDVAPGQPVIFFQNPVADAGLDADTCGLSLTLNAGAGMGVWTVGNGPTGANLSFGNDQAPNSGVTASAPGSYMLTWTVTANGCVGTDDVALNFY
ncbi:MAG: hypothetical protein ABIO24_01870, partial [Saprospiraceae bacterium]